MTYPEAYTQLSDMRARLSSMFGYPSQPGYNAIYRTPDGKRYNLSNGAWCDTGLEWTLTPIDD